MKDRNNIQNDSDRLEKSAEELHSEIARNIKFFSKKRGEGRGGDMRGRRGMERR